MKNWSNIQKQLASEFDLPLDVVKAHTESYWIYIRKSLSKPDTEVVRIMGLGSFRITPQRLFKGIASYLIRIRRYRTGTINQETGKKVLEEALNHLPVLWKLKQKLRWINTSKKLSPKQVATNILKDYEQDK